MTDEQLKAERKAFGDWYSDVAPNELETGKFDMALFAWEYRAALATPAEHGVPPEELGAIARQIIDNQAPIDKPVELGTTPMRWSELWRTAILAETAAKPGQGDER